MVNNSKIPENENSKKEDGCWSKCCDRDKNADDPMFDFGLEVYSESPRESILSVRRQVARKYANVNQDRPPEWSNIDDYVIPVAPEDITFKCDLAYIIDSGKHGAVYKAFFYENYREYDIRKDERYIIKILTRSSSNKIKSEIKVR